MLDHTRENLLRLMAAGGLSVHALSEATGLDERTIRGILNGDNKPHIRTLHRLAEGLDVPVDELFLDPTQLLYRRFDRQTNPLVAEIVERHTDLFVGWTVEDFDELHSHVGEGGALTHEGVLAKAERMNRKREMHDRLELLLESSEVEVVCGIIDLLYQRVTAIHN
jgi:transcriptional regulator with XRE-family HTH domain